MRSPIRSGQGRRLAIGAVGVIFGISVLLLLERVLSRPSYFIVLFVGTMLGVYLIHRSR